MGPGLLLVVGIIYLIVAADYVGEDRTGMALAFLAYALANLGFAMDAWQ